MASCSSVLKSIRDLAPREFDDSEGRVTLAAGPVGVFDDRFDGRPSVVKNTNRLDGCSDPRRLDGLRTAVRTASVTSP